MATTGDWGFSQTCRNELKQHTVCFWWWNDITPPLSIYKNIATNSTESFQILGWYLNYTWPSNLELGVAVRNKAPPYNVSGSSPRAGLGLGGEAGGQKEKGSIIIHVQDVKDNLPTLEKEQVLFFLIIIKWTSAIRKEKTFLWAVIENTTVLKCLSLITQENQILINNNVQMCYFFCCNVCICSMRRALSRTSVVWRWWGSKQRTWTRRGQTTEKLCLISSEATTLDVSAWKQIPKLMKGFWCWTRYYLYFCIQKEQMCCWASRCLRGVE